MGDNLLECYNPLYDVHLRQYFALPHMQKHLRNLGLLDGNQSAADNNNELHAGHLQMMDLMLRNRERVLAQLMDLQRKLDAAEKVELYRRIRSGMTNTEELDRSHLSRSLSRPARSAARFGRDTGEGRRRRQSLSPEAGEMIKRVETDYRSDSAPFKNPKSIYNRLAANVYKYQYLHKLDDRTLHKYMNSLRKQLAKLERFREVSFGPHTMARHQPSQLQQSWFFRRRSLPSLEAAGANHHHPPSQNQPQANAGRRSIKSGLGRKSRSGKSQSPQRASAFEGPPSKLQRTSVSRTRGTQRLPPLPQSAPTKKSASRTFAQRTTPTQQFGKGEARLPPTAVIRPTRKVQEPPPRRNVPVSAGAKIPAGKKTTQENRPASKGSTTPVPVQKPPSAGSGVLPAIGAALAGAAVGAGIAAAASAIGGEDENRKSGAPSPSISLAASQTTTTDGGQPGGDSEWEGEQNGGQGEEEEAKGGTETRPTPEPFLEAKLEEGKEELRMDEEEEEPEGQHTARPSIHSQIQSPEEEQPPEEPEPPKMHYDVEEERNEEVHEKEEEEKEENIEQQKEREAIEHEEMTNLESAPLAAAEENQEEEEPEEPIARMAEEEERAPTNAEQEDINSIEKETPEEVHKIEAENEQQQQIEENEEPAQNIGEEEEFEEGPYTGRSKREVAFAGEEEMPKAVNDESLNYYGKEEWSPRNEERVEEGEEEQMAGEANSPIAASLDAAESERIRQFSHPNLEQENGPEESVRSLASSSVGGSFQREEENRPKSEEENHFGGEEEEAKFEQNEQPIETEMEENEGHEFGNEPTSQMHPEEAVTTIQQQGEEKEIEEKHWEGSEQMPHQETEKEEDAIESHHVQTPVQIEITPSPENRNWDEEGEREYGGEEKAEEMPESEVEKMEHERDINGNEMGGEEMEGGREESSVDAPQLSPEPPATETEYLQEENEADESQNKTPREYEKQEEIKMEENEQENEMPAEGNTFEEQHDVGEEFGGGKGGLEEQELDEKSFEVPEQFGGGQEEEMPKMEEAPNEEIEDKFERVKREVSPNENPQEQQNVVDLVENESVNADEDGAGRKLSGMDAQLGLEGEGMEEIGKAEARDGTEIGQSTADELVENAPLMDEEEQKGPSPEAFDGNMGSEKNAEPVNEFEERNEEGGSHEVRHSENPTMPIKDSMNETPREEFRGTPREEDGIISETGQSIEEGNVEEMGDTKFEGENEHQIESTQENEGQYANQQDGNDESTAPVDVPSEQHNEIRSRPETGESAPQQQRNSLLPSQPSIEITPASEYGGSVEDYGEMNSIQSSQPNSPIQPKEGENGEEMAAEIAEHEETQKQNEINLIEFGSSSPIAQEEFGKTDETEETGQHHQNGHREEEEEQNEQTPLIIEGGEQHQGMMTKGIMDHGHGNGHLLSGEGGNGRGSAASSAETEGADEEGSEAEGSVVIHSGAAGGDQQHFQSVKLEDDDLIAKETI